MKSIFSVLLASLLVFSVAAHNSESGKKKMKEKECCSKMQQGSCMKGAAKAEAVPSGCCAKGNMKDAKSCTGNADAKPAESSKNACAGHNH